MLPPSEVEIDLIRKLEADGVLTPEAVRAALEHYVTSEPPSLMQRAASLITVGNTFMALGILLLFTPLSMLFDILAPWLSRVPVAFYQLALLAVATTATLRPALLWRAKAPYVAVLATCITFGTLWWIVFTWEALGDWLDRLDRAGWPVASMLSGACAVFFAGPALMHESQLLAIAAVGWLSVAFTGGDINARAGQLLSVGGHLAVLAVFISLKARGLYPDQVYVFTFAVEYYCTAALALTLWLGCTDYFLGVAFLYTVAFVAVVAAACVVYNRLAIKTPASILPFFAMLVTLVWVVRLNEVLQGSVGAVMTWVLCGVVLFGFGLLLDRYRELLVFEAPRRPGGPGGGPGEPGSAAAVLLPWPPADHDDRVDQAMVPVLGSEEAC